MEQPRTKTVPAVIANLLRHPQQFTFEQTLRLLRLWLLPGNLEDIPDFIRNVVRVRPALSLGFNATDITELRLKEKFDGQTGEKVLDKILITASFLGLYGTNSPLPKFYTEALFEEESEDISVLRDFLDIFNHRFYFQHAAIASYVSPLFRAYTRGDEKTNHMLLSLASFGDKTLSDQLPSQELFIRYAGLFFQKNRNALGLQIILTDATQCEQTIVHTNCFRLAPIPYEQQFRLGVKNCTLGENASLGKYIPCYDGKIMIEFVNLPIEQFRQMEPSTPSAIYLDSIIKAYCQQRLEYEVKVTLAKNEVTALVLGGDANGHFARLGGDTWLGYGDQETITYAKAQLVTGFVH